MAKKKNLAHDIKDQVKVGAAKGKGAAQKMVDDITALKPTILSTSPTKRVNKVQKFMRDASEETQTRIKTVMSSLRGESPGLRRGRSGFQVTATSAFRPMLARVPKKGKARTYAIAALVTLALLGGGAGYWYSSQTLEHKEVQKQSVHQEAQKSFMAAPTLAPQPVALKKIAAPSSQAKKERQVTSKSKQAKKQKASSKKTKISKKGKKAKGKAARS